MNALSACESDRQKGVGSSRLDLSAISRDLRSWLAPIIRRQRCKVECRAECRAAQVVSDSSRWPAGTGMRSVIRYQGVQVRCTHKPIAVLQVESKQSDRNESRTGLQGW